MGNKHTSQSQHKRTHIDPQQPFNQLPQLFGPLNGYYYHIQDKQLAIENNEQNTNHEIPFLFKYNAVDFENMQKDVDARNQDDDDDKQNDMDLQSASEYQKYRFEWIYIIPNDRAPYYKVKDSSYANSLLPEDYETIRDYLAKHDPIPPHFLRKSRMADMVFQRVLKSNLSTVQHLKCKLITKNVNEKGMVRIEHPALLLWNGKKEFDAHSEVEAFYIIHLRKLPKQYESEEDKKENKETIEIECRPILAYDLERDGWDCKSYKSQDLKLEHGLIDVAHWCLKYEMEHNYEYHQYTR
eukprot:174128_1